ALGRAQLVVPEFDLSNPASVKDHLFGKILRVDQVQAESRDQLTAELTEFVTSVRTGAQPRVDGEQALRAMKVAGLVLESLNTHQWEGTAAGPVGPHQIPQPVSSPPSALRGPISWRSRARGRSSSPAGDS